MKPYFVRFQELATVIMDSTAYRNMEPYNLIKFTYVLGESTASIFTVEGITNITAGVLLL
jgi:hypothetical protein